MKDILITIGFILAIPVCIVLAGILWGGWEWIHKLITNWLFNK